MLLCFIRLVLKIPSSRVPFAGLCSIDQFHLKLCSQLIEFLCVFIYWVTVKKASNLAQSISRTNLVIIWKKYFFTILVTYIVN